MSLEQDLADLVARTVRETLAEVMGEPKLAREALTVPEVGEVCGRSTAWAYEQVAKHGLPAHTSGDNGQMLVSVHALRRWLEGHDTVASLDHRRLAA